MIPYTREQIKALQGKPLDAAVAERIMGWKRPENPFGYWEPSRNR